MTQADGNYAYKELNESLSRLKEVNPTEYEMSTEELLRLGDSVCTTETSDRESFSHHLRQMQMMVKIKTTLWKNM